MSRGLAIVLTVAVGGLVGLQAPMNGRLRGAIGGVPAAVWNNLLGLSALVVLLLLAGASVASDDLHGVPWWAFLGGLCGAAFVFVSLSTVGTLGAAGVTAAAIAGQLTIAVIVDRFGLVGVTRQPLTLARVAGVVLLAAGVLLIVRD